jgi:hypothetical protein
MSEPIAIELTREQINRAGFYSNECLGATALKDHFKTGLVDCGIDSCCVGRKQYSIDNEMVGVINRWFDNQDPSTVEPRTFYITPLE